MTFNLTTALANLVSLAQEHVLLAQGVDAAAGAAVAGPQVATLLDHAQRIVKATRIVAQELGAAPPQAPANS